MSCESCKANAPYAKAFDRLLDSLERRYARREKAHASAEDALVALSRAGRKDDRTTASYRHESARLEEVRLILNAAVREYEKARKANR